MMKIPINPEKIYDIIIYTNYILYTIIFLGISSTAPKYLDELNFYVHIYIAVFLLYRFNPFRKIQFNNLDRKVAFSAGLFILTTSSLNELALNYVHDIQTFIKGKLN